MSDENNERMVIRRRALRIDQDPAHPLYVFALTADELLALADISRLSRDTSGKLLGYQRPEVRSHVANIVEYLDSGDVLFPNPIILALSSAVDFKEARGPKVDEGLAVAGTLEIPVPLDGEAKPAWIVDGQQRTMALMKSKRRNFAVPVNAFVADDVEIQRDQFLRINSSKPLPRGLINELLPEVGTVLPPKLSARKIPAAVCDMLHRDPESPFYGLVRRASMTAEESKRAVVADNSLIKSVSESITSPGGALFPYRNIATGTTDFGAVRATLLTYWSAVREVFPEAWAKPPEKSRLMHGAGIVAMGRLMDRVMASVNPADPKARHRVTKDLEVLRPHCAWTEGAWDGLGGMAWNELQNVTGHTKALSNFLIRTYLDERRVG